MEVPDNRTQVRQLEVHTAVEIHEAMLLSTLHYDGDLMLLAVLLWLVHYLSL